MIEPLYNYILLKKDEQKSESLGGIYIPDNSQEKPSTGVVVRVGNGKINEQTGELIKPYVKAGDRVFFLKLGGQIVKDDDNQEYVILKEDELLGILH